MVAPLQHHLLGVHQGLGLPCVAADVLPAGNFGEHQQAYLVAPVNKMLALGIVAGAHRVAAQLILEDVRVQPLGPGGHGIAHVGPALVPVQPSQLHPPAVEIKAVRPKFHPAEAEAHRPLIHRLALLQQHGLQMVKVRVLAVPQSGLLHFQERFLRFGIALPAGQFPAAFAAHRKAQGEPGGVFAGGQAAHGAVHVRPHAEVIDEGGAAHLQKDFPVQPAVGQVVNDVAERGHVQRFPAVQLHRQVVGFAPAQPVGQVNGESGVAAAVLRQQRPVEIHPGKVGRALKGHPHPFAPPAFRRGEKAQIAAHHLIGLFAELVEGQHRHRVGQAHPFKVFLRGVQRGQRRFIMGREIPVVVPRDAFHAFSSRRVRIPSIKRSIMPSMACT